MSIAIVRYNAGNTLSVMNALRRLGLEGTVTDDPDILRSASRVIFPGVGEASTAMRYLRDRNLDDVLSSLTQPVLGICLGLQLMCRESEENDATGLGIFDLDVKRFNASVKVPHMGWNRLTRLRGPLFDGLDEPPYVYFVHSYYAEIGSATVAGCDYGVDFSAALHHDNFFAVQFHPEKSGKVGSAILQNFLSL